jgi:cytochrome oxidase Cu insertion factor (SCO1/SenC/PrrC family)
MTHAMGRQGALAALLALALCAACSEQKPIGKARLEEGEPLPVGSFDFLERSGKPLTDEDLKGKVWVGALIFTNCTGICMPMCVEMARLQDEFKDEPDFRIVATTVDPDRDTAEVLAKFAKSYSADPDRWYFLTGKKEDIRKFAVEGLRIPWKDDEPVTHSPDLVLVGRDGNVQDYFRQLNPDEMKRLREVIKSVLASTSDAKGDGVRLERE